MPELGADSRRRMERVLAPEAESVPKPGPQTRPYPPPCPSLSCPSFSHPLPFTALSFTALSFTTLPVVSPLVCAIVHSITLAVVGRSCLDCPEWPASCLMDEQKIFAQDSLLGVAPFFVAAPTSTPAHTPTSSLWARSATRCVARTG